MMVNKNNFYCYSYKLHQFLKLYDVFCISSGVHHVTNRRFWVYKASDKLDDARKDWARFKDEKSIFTKNVKIDTIITDRVKS